MKCALLYPPFAHKIFNENLSTVDEEFGCFPYISFGYVARVMKNLGHQVQLFDAAATKLTYEEIRGQITAFNPDLISIPAHAVQTFPDALTWVKRIKNDLGIAILVGGYESTAYAQEIFSHCCFDFLLVGDIWKTLPLFLEVFEKGHGDYRTIPNFWYRDPNGVVRQCAVVNKGLAKVAFREFALPDRSIFDHSLYYSHVSQRKYFTVGMSSIGCPYNCSYCCMATSSFEARTPEQVLAEIEDCLKQGIHEIDWFDPLMFYDRGRIIEICSEIERRKLNIIWSTRTRIDTLALQGNKYPDEKFIEILARGGCRRLFMGIESGSDQILKNVHKGLELKNVSKIFDCANRHGINLLGFFMIGNPGETKQTIKKTIKLAQELPLTYAQFSITVMKPHTELSSLYMESSLGYDYWKRWMRGEAQEMLLPSPWTTLTRAQLEHWTKFAYLQFYFRPSYILRTLLKIESSRELWRYIKVAVKMLSRNFTEGVQYLILKVKKMCKLQVTTKATPLTERSTHLL
ncbi:MAG: B12-binding domain-containing radical SAM protein [Oligoflexia bacterium]|nr:B12-binding domain-containing radical SAM protein [Oligoflexia bacterium]